MVMPEIQIGYWLCEQFIKSIVQEILAAEYIRQLLAGAKRGKYFLLAKPEISLLFYAVYVSEQAVNKVKIENPFLNIIGIEIVGWIDKTKILVLVRKWGDRQLNQMSNSPLILTSRFV